MCFKKTKNKKTTVFYILRKIDRLLVAQIPRNPQIHVTLECWKLNVDGLSRAARANGLFLIKEPQWDQWMIQRNEVRESKWTKEKFAAGCGSARLCSQEKMESRGWRPRVQGQPRLHRKTLVSRYRHTYYMHIYIHINMCEKERERIKNSIISKVLISKWNGRRRNSEMNKHGNRFFQRAKQWKQFSVHSAQEENVRKKLLQVESGWPQKITQVLTNKQNLK